MNKENLRDMGWYSLVRRAVAKGDLTSREAMECIRKIPKRCLINLDDSYKKDLGGQQA